MKTISSFINEMRKTREDKGRKRVKPYNKGTEEKISKKELATSFLTGAGTGSTLAAIGQGLSPSKGKVGTLLHNPRTVGLAALGAGIGTTGYYVGKKLYNKNKNI